MGKINTSNYQTSCAHQKANWFRTQFFCGRKKFVHYKQGVTIAKPGVYVARDSLVFKKEPFGKTILKILGYCTLLFPLIGLIFIKHDEKHWRNYKKTDAYQESKWQWERVFAKGSEGEAFHQASVLIDALIRSGRSMDDLRFKHILAKNLDSNANQIFGGEGVLPDSEKPEHFKKHLTLYFPKREMTQDDFDKILVNNPALHGKTSLHAIPAHEFYAPQRLVQTPHLPNRLEQLLFRK